MTTPRVLAAQALAKCSAYDPWFPKPSESLVTAWAEHFEPHQLSAADVLDGVKRAYSERGAGFKPLPKDITDAARAIRRERAEEEPREMREARQEALAAKAAEDAEELAERKGLPGPDKFRRRALPAALNVRCPWCKANIGNRCVVPNTNERPAGGFHPSRIEAASVTA